MDLDRHWPCLQRRDSGALRSLRLGALGDLTLRRPRRMPRPRLRLPPKDLLTDDPQNLSRAVSMLIRGYVGQDLPLIEAQANLPDLSGGHPGERSALM